MRIGFNARVLTQSNLRGWNRYTLNLLSKLASLGLKVYLYLDRDCDPTQLSALCQNAITFRQSSAMNYLLWEQCWIPKQCAADKIDIFHSPIHFGLPQFTKVGCVLTLHDAIDQVYYSSKVRKTRSQSVTSMLGWMSRRRADHIITVSEHSRQDLLRYLGIPSEKLSVIYEAADFRFSRRISTRERERVRSKHGLQRPYFLYVGSLEKRKNIPFFLRAFSMAKFEDVDVAIAGKWDEQEVLELLKLTGNLSISDQVLLLGQVSDADLPALYAEARCFVYPSEYEGFGLQICEACAAGCPVLAADATCLPEILGNGGETFSLSNVEDLQNRMVRLHRDPVHWEAARKRARARATDFSWSHTARQTLAVYEKVRSARH